jgi:peroxiredoxin
MERKFSFVSSVALAIFLLLNGGAGLAQKQTYNYNDVSLRKVGGEAVTLENLKGKVTVLAIGASWLPLSKQQAAIANQLTQTYGKRNVIIYFVSTDADDAKSKNYATDQQLTEFGARNKLTTTILRDTAGTTLKFFNVDQIPAFVILDKQGKVAGVITGLDSENNTSEAVSQISAEIDKVL